MSRDVRLAWWLMGSHRCRGVGGRLCALLVGVVLLLLSARAAEAACTWDADLVQETGGAAHAETSKRVTLTWDEYNDSDCSTELGGDFGHYRIEYAASDPGTWEPGEGTLVATISNIGTTLHVHRLGWADFTGNYAVFLCGQGGSPSCTDHNTQTDYLVEASTEPEKFVMKGLTKDDHDVSDGRVASTGSGPTHAAEVLRIADDWTDEFKLALMVWDADEQNGTWVYTSSTNQWVNWNSHTGFSSPSDPVLENASAGDFDGTMQYAWARKGRIGSEEALLAAVPHFDSGLHIDGGIVLVWGAEDTVADLDLECGDTGDCGAGPNCLEGDLCDFADDDGSGNTAIVLAEAGDHEMDIYAHGRFIWQQPNVDVVDLCNVTMHMLFTGHDDDPAGEVGDTAEGDIFLFKGTKPSTCTGVSDVMDASNWEVIDTGAAGKPKAVIADAHDPFTIPVEVSLAGGGLTATNVYARNWGDHPTASYEWTTHYTQNTGRTYKHTATPEFYFDDGTGKPDTDTNDLMENDGHEALADCAGVRWPGTGAQAGTFFEGIFCMTHKQGVGSDFEGMEESIVFLDLYN